MSSKECHLSLSLPERTPFSMTQFPSWHLLGDKNKSSTERTFRLAPHGPEPELVGPTSLRISGSGSRFTCPQWASVHGNNMSALCAQGGHPLGGWHVLGCRPKDGC